MEVKSRVYRGGAPVIVAASYNEYYPETGLWLFKWGIGTA